MILEYRLANCDNTLTALGIINPYIGFHAIDILQMAVHTPI